MTYPSPVAMIAALFMVTTATAESVNHDVSGYDIAGVTLGMGTEQAMDKVVENLGVARDDMRVSNTSPNPVTGQDEISYFQAETNDFEILVSLTAAVPSNAETPMVVSQIKFTMPRTPDNQAAMKTRAIEKYGTPTRGSADEPAHFPTSWCTIPADMPTASCAAVPGARIQLGSSFGGIELSLFDPGYANAVADFVNGEKSSAPKF